MDRVKLPTYISDYMNLFKQNNLKFIDAIRAPFSIGFMGNHKFNKIRKWMSKDENSEVFARAWVDGYETEEELYYIRFCPNDRAAYLNAFRGDLGNKSKWQVTGKDETDHFQSRFSECQIKNYFPEFKPFAIKAGDDDGCDD